MTDQQQPAPLRDQIDDWLARKVPVRRVPDQWTAEDLSAMAACNPYLRRLMTKSRKCRG